MDTSTQADAISNAATFLADALIDGVDVEILSQLASDQPMVLALVADMVIAHVRNGLTDDERVVFANALRFSVIASLAERPI